MEFPVHPATECCKVGTQSYIFTIDNETLLFKFTNKEGMCFYYSLVLLCHF